MPRGGRGTLIIEQQYEAPGLESSRIELPTLTCFHCGTITVLNPKRVRPREWCMKCDAYVCDKRVCVTECHPFKQSLDISVANNGDEPYLVRGADGSVLYDPRKERKIY